ncbi:MAG: NosD domain-containing protein [Thermofilaceae archaeon]
MLRLGLTVLVASVVALALICGYGQRSQAQASQRWLIRILPDGSISPHGAPVRRVDRVYYLTEDLEAWGSDGIVIEASGIILNGNGHRLKGDGARDTRGVIVRGSRVTVLNLTVEAFQLGVMVTGAEGVEVRNVTVLKCSEGVSVVNSTGVSVIGNLLVDTVTGVNLLFSHSVEVAENRVVGGVWGIYVMNSSSVTVARNTVVNSSWGLMLLYSGGAKVVENELWGCGVYVRASFRNTISNNSVNGRPLVYLEEVEGGEVREAGQVVLVRSRGVRVANLSISRASVGVLLYESSGITVENCTLSRNIWGIMLHTSHNNTIRGNWVESSDVGIYLYESKGNLVAENALLRNGLGLWLACSARNTVQGNCFIANRAQASAGCGENRWTDYGGGNYWSDGSDEDRDGDGYADDPYRVGPGNIDERPLTACRLESVLRLPAPFCTLELLSQPSEVLAGEYFLVAIKAESPLPLKAVRFEIRAGEQRETGYFAWDRSSGPWDAVRKVFRTRARLPGTATIEAFLKDSAGRQTSCATTVNVVERGPQSEVGNPELAPQLNLPALAAVAVMLAAAGLVAALVKMRGRRATAS